MKVIFKQGIDPESVREMLLKQGIYMRRYKNGSPSSLTSLKSESVRSSAKKCTLRCTIGQNDQQPAQKSSNFALDFENHH